MLLLCLFKFFFNSFSRLLHFLTIFIFLKLVLSRLNTMRLYVNVCTIRFIIYLWLWSMPAIKARWRWAAEEVEDGTDSEPMMELEFKKKRTLRFSYSYLKMLIREW